MTPNQNFWNENQKILRQKLPKALDFDNMKQILLKHHAMVHSVAVTDAGVWSFEDEVLQDLTDTDMRGIPSKQEHSIVWIMWHIARIEDVTMNILVAGQPQIFHADNWLKRMNVPFQDTGNEMSDKDMAILNKTMNIAALRDYRVAVGQESQNIIQGLRAETIQQKVDPKRILQVRDSEIVAQAAHGIIDYWGKRTIAGLLLMPATRHNFVHLNEASRIKQAIKKS